MMNKIELIAKQELLKSLKSAEDLAQLLELPLFNVQLMATNPIYNCYHVKKSNGKNRWIEDPSDDLKQIQRSLNELLQAWYYKIRPAAAFGFQLTLKNEKNPRNIKTNALSHVGKPWLINIDFSDFFHQITATMVSSILKDAFPLWQENLVHIITQLCTYKGRLPMGAPTSPVLANWAVIDLDNTLQKLCQDLKITYTRFVDDLSFSSLMELDEAKTQQIFSVIESFDLKVNKSKTKVYPPNIPKIVSGLVVDNKVTVAPGFEEQLLMDIQKFGHALEINYALNPTNLKIEKAEAQIKGRIQFLEFIEGKNHKTVKKAKNQLEKAKMIDAYQVISWQELDYHKFINGTQ